VSDNLLWAFAFMWTREQEGVAKYGVTLDDQPDEGYKGRSWETMLSEELGDGLNYAVRDNRRLRKELENLREIAFGSR
jgi:hypothetical protein